MRERDRLCIFGEGCIQCSVEMHFEQTDAANASSIQKFPMIDQARLFENGQLPLQSPQHTSEHLCLLFFGGIIAGKMDIDTPASQLRVDFPKGTKFVGAYENVAHPRQILKIFQMIKLILES